MFRPVWLLSVLSLLCSAKLVPIDFDNGILFSSRDADAGEGVAASASASGMFKWSNETDPFMGVNFLSGYIPVGEAFGGEMFYWYFPQAEGELKDSTPLIVWLTGGPGCSSAMAALTENGPLNVETNGTVSANVYSWTRLGEVVYIDQPLGTGFSTIGDPQNAVRNEDQVAEDLREFLVSFALRYPQVEGRPLYITGESYAGHYIPAMSRLLVTKPIDAYNFVGMAIGNGWVSPVVQYPYYASYAYEHNMVGEVGYHLAEKALQFCVQLIEKKLNALALIQCNAVSDGLLGKKNPYDVRLNCDVPPLCYNHTTVETFLNNPTIQARLNVKKRWVECNSTVYLMMLGDWCSDMTSHVADVLAAGKRVLIYNGDQDYICNWEGGLAWVNQVPWKRREDFASAKLQQWSVNGRRYGAAKQIENFTFLRVYGAGHMVPMDQSAAALEMMSQWINNDSGLIMSSSESNDKVSNKDNELSNSKIPKIPIRNPRYIEPELTQETTAAASSDFHYQRLQIIVD